MESESENGRKTILIDEQMVQQGNCMQLFIWM